ncbi:general stress protein [Metabacillus niabensis]|uniref:general stress protein n=1 Tax=Metabacillus niabensis TaxID=324854 RepID=UPI001CFC1B1A|nr:general stress protein [Metabacillus niabensis]
MMNLKTYVVENGVQATQIIQELEGQGYDKDHIYLFAHDTTRSKHLTEQTDTRQIGLKEEGVFDKVANVFRSRGDMLRDRMTSLGVSQDKANELEEELDEGRVVIVAQ